ncbi:hypothetical protein B0H14DRAFT_2635651 [Mycena olivaceomarginata]|nr:hypothetical protein B0H14DRAFT_2635651 [Mycena olivaceomarginata]
MPASTESSHTKASRFSPLAPLLSHPRKASRITLERTSKLFSSQPVDGQGALCSQVPETQFFEQFNVDVSCGRESSPITTPPRREPPASLSKTPTKSSPATTPIIEDAEESEFDFGDNYQSGTNSWAWHLPEEDEEDLSLAETWSESSAQFTPISLMSMDFPLAALVPLRLLKTSTAMLSKTGFRHTRGNQPDALEQWIIGRVREARQDGISAADGFRCLRNRCLERERWELNLMAHELDLARRLNEIHNLSKNVE